MKILVVDDEDNIRRLISYNLTMDGHQIILANNGKECLEKVKEKPDLILLDVMMPEMNGLETCLRLKNDPQTKLIPVFMLTAKSQLNNVEKAFKAGANDYITKPFDPVNLNEQVLLKYKKYKEIS